MRLDHTIRRIGLGVVLVSRVGQSYAEMFRVPMKTDISHVGVSSVRKFIDRYGPAMGWRWGDGETIELADD